MRLVISYEYSNYDGGSTGERIQCLEYESPEAFLCDLEDTFNHTDLSIHYIKFWGLDLPRKELYDETGRFCGPTVETLEEFFARKVLENS